MGNAFPCQLHHPYQYPPCTKFKGGGYTLSTGKIDRGPAISSDQSPSSLRERINRLREKSRRKPNEPKEDTPSVRLWLGVDFAAACLTGVALGFGFDKLFETFPWGLLGGAILGNFAGVWTLYRTLFKGQFSKKKDHEE